MGKDELKSILQDEIEKNTLLTDKGHAVITDQIKAKIVDLRNKGFTFRDIERTLNLGKNVASYHYVRTVDMKKKKGKKKEQPKNKQLSLKESLEKLEAEEIMNTYETISIKHKEMLIEIIYKLIIGG